MAWRIPISIIGAIQIVSMYSGMTVTEGERCILETKKPADFSAGFYALLKKFKLP